MTLLSEQSSLYEIVQVTILYHDWDMKMQQVYS